MSNRRKREQRTVAIMIRMFCRARHRGGESLCPECVKLTDYALERIEKCRFGADKPACAQCATHCFKPDMRARIRSVMRYSGPRMMFRHPILALHHLRNARSGRTGHGCGGS